MSWVLCKKRRTGPEIFSLKKSKQAGTLGTKQDNDPFSLGDKEATECGNMLGVGSGEHQAGSESGAVMRAGHPFPVVHLSPASHRVWKEGSLGLCPGLRVLPGGTCWPLGSN